MEKTQLHNLIKDPQLLNNDTLPQLKEVTEKYPLFQTGWMLYLKNLRVLQDENFDEVLKKVAVRVQNRKALYQYINDVATVKPFTQMDMSPQNIAGSQEYQIEGDVNSPGNPLIDRFLTSGFDSFRSDEDLDTVDYMAEEEIIDEVLPEEADGNFVTETLAALYYKQKKYDKAIDTFEKLSLKYPEKSVYFADRIEEIEKLKTL